MKFEISEDIIFYAFRYCLGRQTYCVSDFVHEVIAIAPRLPKNVKTLMINEIDEAIEAKRAGAEIDKAEWLRLKNMLQKSEQTGNVTAEGIRYE